MTITSDEVWDPMNVTIGAMKRRSQEEQVRVPQLQRIDFGLLRLKRLKAVAHWACKQKRSNIPVDHHALTAEVLVEMIEEMNLDEADYTLSTEKL
mgnify:CR=1 FL=1